MNRGWYAVQLDRCGFVPAGWFRRGEVVLGERYFLDWVQDDSELNPFLWVALEGFGLEVSSCRRLVFVPGGWSQQVACPGAWFRLALQRQAQGVFWQRAAKLIPSLPARIAAESNLWSKSIQGSRGPTSKAWDSGAAVRNEGCRQRASCAVGQSLKEGQKGIELAATHSFGGMNARAFGVKPPSPANKPKHYRQIWVSSPPTLESRDGHSLRRKRSVQFTRPAQFPEIREFL